MSYEFPKSEKKLARQVIEMGLQRDFQKSILDLDRIIRQWRSKKLDNRDTYHQLYRSLKESDKYIARMYDDQRGSTYMITIQALLRNKVISETDLSEFPEKTKNDILGIRKILGDGL